MGNLYIVATPIGNLQDITIRAIEVLTSVAYIVAERPEKTRLLLSEMRKRYQTLVKQEKRLKIISMNEYEEVERIPEVISLLANGDDVALVSEAGTPLLSDPGFKLVREAWKRGIRVIPIPGVSSITAALSASSLPTDKFLFLGFPPKKTEKRKTFFSEISGYLKKSHVIQPTLVMFESPHRILESLSDLQEIFGNIDIVLAREITKLHEEFLKKKISEYTALYQTTKPRGEFVLLFKLEA